MSEIKHQFCVGDWVMLKQVDLRPGDPFYMAIKAAVMFGPHQIVQMKGTNYAKISALGCENLLFGVGSLVPHKELVITPIDDLI